MKTFVLATLLILSSLSASAEVLDRIVAKVGSEIITLSDTLEAIRNKKDELDREHSNLVAREKLKQYKANLIDELILDKILDQEIKREGIVVADERVESEYRFRLRRQKLTEGELIRELQKNQLSLAEYKARVRKQMASQDFMRKKIMSKVRISDYELQKNYKENAEKYSSFSKVRFIEVLLNPAVFPSLSEHDRIADQIHQGLEAGNDMTAMIKKHSQGAFSKKGGDSGLIEFNSLQSEIQDVLRSLDVGQTSPVFKLPKSTFIFKLLEKKDKKPQPYSKVASQVRAEYIESKAKEKLREYLQGVRGQTFVEVYQK